MVKRAKNKIFFREIHLLLYMLIISTSKWWNGQKGHEFLATLKRASFLRLNMRDSDYTYCLVNTQVFLYRLVWERPEKKWKELK